MAVWRTMNTFKGCCYYRSRIVEQIVAPNKKKFLRVVGIRHVLGILVLVQLILLRQMILNPAVAHFVVQEEEKAIQPSSSSLFAPPDRRSKSSSRTSIAGTNDGIILPQTTTTKEIQMMKNLEDSMTNHHDTTKNNNISNNIQNNNDPTRKSQIIQSSTRNMTNMPPSTLLLSQKTTTGQSTPPPPVPPIQVVAYAISVTSCQVNSTSVLDGAAVLGHSIHLSSIRTVNSTSNYDYALYAFVDSEDVDRTCRDILSQLGYKVLIKEHPPFFQVKDIQNNELRTLIEQNGCCGSKEYLKLYAYSLMNHPIVVHIDTDVLILKPLDRLFDTMLLQQQQFDDDHDADGELGSTNDKLYPHGRRQILPPHHIMSSNNNKDKDRNGTQSVIVTQQSDFFFTRDYHQGSRITKQNPKKFGVQGGFFVLRPNITFLEEIGRRILNETYSKRRGWSGRQYTGFWGAAQIQGYLAYIYGEYYPHRAVELNRCIYNSMINDDPYDKITGHCRTTGGDDDNDEGSVCDDCRETPLEEIQTIHLTTCRKPFECPHLRPPHPPLCKEAHKAWYEVRKSLELSWGQDPPTNGWHYEWTLGYCRRIAGTRKREYLPLQFPPK